MQHQNPLAGYKLIEDPTALEQTGTTRVVRSFRERFFSLPWKPWQLTTEVPVFGPKEDFEVTDDCIIGHPTLIRALREHHRIED